MQGCLHGRSSARPPMIIFIFVNSAAAHFSIIITLTSIWTPSESSLCSSCWLSAFAFLAFFAFRLVTGLVALVLKNLIKKCSRALSYVHPMGGG